VKTEDEDVAASGGHAEVQEADEDAADSLYEALRLRPYLMLPVYEALSY
jgi:hypothetical protein